MWLWILQTLYYVVKEKVLSYWHLPIASTYKACQAKLVYILQENPKMRANLIMLEGNFGYALTESKVSKQSLWALNRHICIFCLLVVTLVLFFSSIITPCVGIVNSTSQASRLMTLSTFLQYTSRSFGIKSPIFLTLAGHLLISNFS